MQAEITDAFDALSDTRDADKYNVAIGFFQDYSQLESDTTGKRFCDIKLHYKDANGVDIAALGVPIMYMGSDNFILDFELTKGVSELIVLFSDKTLEQWKDTSGTVPQELKNPVKDSINHALAIPICTVHNANLVSAVPVNSNAIGLRAKDGKKIEIGNGTVELVNMVEELRAEVAALQDYIQNTITFTNSGGATGPPTNATVIQPIADALDVIETDLAEIKV